MHLNFSPLLLAGGFTKWSSLLLRVSWRRWESVSWQLLPRNKDRRHLLRGSLESYVFHQDAEWIQRRNSILHISTTSGLVCGALTGMRSTWVMSMARHCARRVRQLSRLLSFTAQPGGGAKMICLSAQSTECCYVIFNIFSIRIKGPGVQIKHVILPWS